MKQGLPGMLLIAAGLLAGCAHQQAVKLTVPGATAIEDSVLPVYVHATGQETEQKFGRTKTVTSRYHACAGVYVRPNVLATAIIVFPGAADESSVQYLGDIFVGADGDNRTVKAFHTHELVALIVTEETGRPLPLRPGQAAQGEKLIMVGPHFTEAPRASAHAPAEFRGEPAVITDSPFAVFADEDMAVVYKASLDVQPGQCGAPLLDDAGRLVGIVSIGVPAKREASVINAAMIATALKEFGL